VSRILVVEDEPGIALGLEDSLRLEGYHVEVASNGTTGSRLALERPFDLILLDVMLPGKNGFEVCRELRRSGLEIPIIFLTARTQESDRVEGLNLGANDFVSKPFSPLELMARIRGMLRFVEQNRRDRRRLEDEIDAASQVQQRLFPSSRPTIAGFDYAGAFRPARGVSGDYYDFLLLPSGRLAILLADVSGKGMPASLLAASLHAAVRAYAPAADCRTGELLSLVNHHLYETTAPERFITIFYAVYDPPNRTLTWSNAGHCAPIRIGRTSRCERLESLSPPAGMFPEMEVCEQTTQLHPGDCLLIVSDGITEAGNSTGEEFGEARLTSLVRRQTPATASGVCDAVLGEVREFSRGFPQADDQTVVAARVL